MDPKPAKQAELNALLAGLDPALTENETIDSIDVSPLSAALESYFAAREFTAAVLGIDIYRYSKYEPAQQRIVPSLFGWLYQQAANNCKQSEPFLFQGDQFGRRFISTGDGGFSIFDTPLHALVFAAYFQARIAAFNAGITAPRLRRFLGLLTLRYALTYDRLFHLDDNYYGPAIINNSRVLLRDSLNRFLVDGPAVVWFAMRFGSVETLQAFESDSLKTVADFRSYDGTLLKPSLFFPMGQGGRPQSNITAIASQHIGEIESKQQKLDIYSIYLQMSWKLGIVKPGQYPMVVSLGNLNSSGLTA